MELSQLHQGYTLYRRRPSKTVWVGQVGVGGGYPIRVQSMATAATTNTDGVVKEIRQLVDAGCEIIRLTVPTQADCDNLPNIKAALKKNGIKVPLVADIHFTPSIAMKAVEYVDKVRINPGNFVDKKLFKERDYTDAEYEEELIRIREKFLPLVLKCKEYGVAMRIGTNHGSLSDRIMNRYGDTPQGMVESALEFARICEDVGYSELIFSMKASNVQVMIAAYRLLAYRLAEVGRLYPLHLGVTEAGEGEDGRVKSAIGIGTLLEDGIGDTIRVSLTEDAVYEVPVAYALVKKYNSLIIQDNGSPKPEDDEGWIFGSAEPSLSYTRRESDVLISTKPCEVKLGGSEPVRVWAPFVYERLQDFEAELKEHFQNPTNADLKLEGVELTAEHVIDPSGIAKMGIPVSLLLVEPNQVPTSVSKVVLVLDEHDLLDAQRWETLLKNIGPDVLIEWCIGEGVSDFENMADMVLQAEKLIDKFGLHKRSLFSVVSADPIEAYRGLSLVLSSRGVRYPLHVRVMPQQGENILLASSVALGSLLNDGVGDSIQIEAPLTPSQSLTLSYQILQGCRIRITKAEFISCPSCGRTQFDLQTTTDRIRQRTEHLKGIKIAVMGCIVNGPGEMADADFGYVGTGPKKVSLYVGKECVTRNIPEEDAVNQLVNLIKEHGKWQDA